MKQDQKKTVKRGDRLLTEEPFVHVLQSKYRQERCDQCLNHKSKVLKCSKCKYVYYCNRDCQMKGWLLHKIECPFLERVYPRVVPDLARMICKVIIKLEKGGDMIRGFYAENCSRKFRDLMSHYAEIKIDSRRLEHVSSLYSVLNEMMEGSFLVPNQTEFMCIYGRLITNSFNILDGEMHSIGTAVYLGASILDHSCKPNAVATFEGTTLHIQALEDMDCIDWSKIFISYVELLDLPEQRIDTLKANYYFECKCPKCNDPLETQLMNAASCPNSKCNAQIRINKKNCPLCGSGISPKYRENFNEAMAITKNHLKTMKDIAYLDVCKICIDKQKGVSHPLNVWWVKTLDAAFDAAIQIKKWSDALLYGTELLPGFRKYYGDWNPLLGLLYLKIGKIQLFQNLLKEAKRNLEEAYKILQVTHGRDHSLIQECLQPMIAQVNTESLR